MKQLLPFIFLVSLLAPDLLAQDVIYTAGGNRIENARLVSLNEDNIQFSVQGKDTPYSFKRQNILFAFSNTGNFLVISELSSDLVQAQAQLQRYLVAPARTDSRDFLVRAVPLEVIPATISYSGGDLVNYKTVNGQSASIPTSALAMILYHDGKHKLFREYAEVAGLLPAIRAALLEPDTKPVSATQQTSSPPPPAPTNGQDSTEKLKESAPADPNVVININVPTQSPVVTPAPVLQQVSPVESAGSPPATDAGRPKLDEADYQLYRKKALQKVDEFVSYLNIITDKKLSGDEKDNAIAQAAKLFMPAATIAVTSANRPGSRQYPIRDYLNRLKLLPYSSAKIEWSEMQYIKELSQAADGNYYGVITGQQTFIGYGNKGDNIIYSDVVQKRVRVKLAQYTPIIEGKAVTRWDILLGNIGVAAQ